MFRVALFAYKASVLLRAFFLGVISAVSASLICLVNLESRALSLPPIPAATFDAVCLVKKKMNKSKNDRVKLEPVLHKSLYTHVGVKRDP